MMSSSKNVRRRRFGYAHAGMWMVALACWLVASIQSAEVTAQTSNALQWKPLLLSSAVTSEELFPAQVLALSARRAASVTPNYIGDPNGAIGVQMISPAAGSRVRVTIKVDQLSEPSVIEATLPEVGKVYELWPVMRFDTRALARARESFPTTATFSIAVDGTTAAEQTRTIQVRSVNDVPFMLVPSNGGPIDLGYMFAAYVNENSPVIDAIFRDALAVNAVQRFKGYQGTPAEVIREAFAIWNVLQRRGIRYSSITTPSGQSQAVLSQHVRFADEALSNAQANCADGSALFASALYKLGIFPALVKVPGHMFVGFFADRNRQQQMFIETTMLGEPGLNSAERGWRFLTADGALTSRSYQLFQQAVARGNAEFQAARPSLLAKSPGYLLIDIDVARHAGIAAIPSSLF